MAALLARLQSLMVIIIKNGFVVVWLFASHRSKTLDGRTWSTRTLRARRCDGHRRGGESASPQTECHTQRSMSLDWATVFSLPGPNVWFDRLMTMRPPALLFLLSPAPSIIIQPAHPLWVVFHRLLLLLVHHRFEESRLSLFFTFFLLLLPSTHTHRRLVMQLLMRARLLSGRVLSEMPPSLCHCALLALKLLTHIGRPGSFSLRSPVNPMIVDKKARALRAPIYKERETLEFVAMQNVQLYLKENRTVSLKKTRD